MPQALEQLTAPDVGTQEMPFEQLRRVVGELDCTLPSLVRWNNFSFWRTGRYLPITTSRGVQRTGIDQHGHHRSQAPKRLIVHCFKLVLHGPAARRPFF